GLVCRPRLRPVFRGWWRPGRCGRLLRRTVVAAGDAADRPRSGGRPAVLPGRPPIDSRFRAGPGIDREAAARLLDDEPAVLRREGGVVLAATRAGTRNHAAADPGNPGSSRADEAPPHLGPHRRDRKSVV